MDSILTTCKDLIGIDEADTNFDSSLIVYINSVFATLTQMGLGPTTGFSIIDDEDVWTDFMSASAALEMVKSYVPEKVKLKFDPPLSTAALEALKQDIAELEWRLSVSVAPSAT